MASQSVETNEIQSASSNDFDVDQQTQQQQNQIEREIIDNQPLVSEKISTSQLQNEYASDDKIYQDKVAVRECSIEHNRF